MVVALNMVYKRKFDKVAGNSIKICSPAHIGTYNRHVKFELKIHKCLGENVRKNHGDFFDSDCNLLAQGITCTG